VTSLNGRDSGYEKSNDLDDLPMILIERSLEAGRKRIELFCCFSTSRCASLRSHDPATFLANRDHDVKQELAKPALAWELGLELEESGFDKWE
jgi:hypothetical protein